MQTLRTSLTLARLVLAWFMLTFGVAVASPVIAPQTLVMLCSHEGTKAVVVDANGDVVTSSAHTLDCPLCLPAVAPPPAFTPPLPVSGFAITLPPGRLTQFLAAPVGAPLPARGPPASA